LREHETTVAGPSLRGVIDPVEPDDLRRAVKGVLQEWWGPIIVDPGRLRDPGYQPYAVLLMCRALYTLEHGATATKSAAVQWTIGAQGGKWTALVERALSWEPNHQAPGDLGPTLELIKHTVARGREVDPASEEPLVGDSPAGGESTNAS
jgi:hypothetical protein